jgi:hypothetical protein
VTLIRLFKLRPISSHWGRSAILLSSTCHLKKNHLIPPRSGHDPKLNMSLRIVCERSPVVRQHLSKRRADRNPHLVLLHQTDDERPLAGIPRYDLHQAQRVSPKLMSILRQSLLNLMRGNPPTWTPPLNVTVPSLVQPFLNNLGRRDQGFRSIEPASIHPRVGHQTCQRETSGQTRWVR